MLLPSMLTNISMAFEFWSTSMSCEPVERCLIALTAVTRSFGDSDSHAFSSPGDDSSATAQTGKESATHVSG